MAKALKPLIVILLLCSIAALSLGIMLFQQREILKRRTQILENAADSFAKSIRHDAFKVAQVKNYESMQGPLNLLAAAGRNQFDDLQNTKQDLENTRQDLAQTKMELATTKSELSDARDQIAQLSDTLRQREADLAEANSQIEGLEEQTVSLQSEIDDLNSQVAEFEENLVECEANYESLLADFKKLAGETQKVKGLAGKILLVNPAWNFVVLDIGTNEGLTPTAEMLVHRSDRLVGRVRISSANESMAVAEILGDWEQMAIRKGDYVISPES